MKALKTICFLTALTVIGALFAGDIPKVMVINSNAAVEKYHLAQEAFKQTFYLPVLEVDLDEPQWKISKVEELLYDEYPDLIYCIGTKAYLIANKFVSERHIVFSSMVNWQRLPMTKTTYGVSNELYAGMQLTLYRYMFPWLKRIGILYSRQYNREWFDEASTLSSDMGIEIIGHPIHKSRQVLSSLADMLTKIDALWLISDPLVMPEKETIQGIFESCDSARVPIFSYHEGFVDYGAVLIVVVDNPTTGRQAADIAREVLTDKRQEPSVQLPAGSSVILNLNRVHDYGLTYNEAALGAVNQIIE